MDEKISQKEVEQYSEAYANRLADQFFNKKEKISGPEILSLCEIKQVYLFVVRELRHLWKLEMGKLKSHYFDYHSKEVKEALEQMQNVLSNQISIEKNDFLPLLKTAISRTIILILACTTRRARSPGDRRRPSRAWPDAGARFSRSNGRTRVRRNAYHRSAPR